MKIIYVALFCMLAISCKDKKVPDCGCDGPTIQTLENIKASYLENGNFLLRNTNEAGYNYETSVVSCTMDSTLTKTADIREPDYLISGELKQQCNQQPSYSSMFVPNALLITKIEKIP